MTQVFTRREALQLAITGGGAALVVACGGAPQVPSAPSKPDLLSAPAAATPSSTAQPKSGGTLRYGLASPLTSIWPVFAGTEGTQDMYDKLLTYDANLQPVPLLIETWDLASDYKQIKL